MYNLGISCYYHDSAAALLKDGHVIAAVEEERFTEIKHDYNFPVNSIKWCLQHARVKLNQINEVHWYENPDSTSVRPLIRLDSFHSVGPCRTKRI